jgi:dynein heavy chain
MKLLDCFLEPFFQGKDEGKEEREIDQARVKALPDLIEPWFLFSVVWTIGATCDTDGRLKFDRWFRQKMTDSGVQMAFPEEGVVYDYRLADDGSRVEGGDDDDDDGDGPLEVVLEWKRWTDGVDAPTIDPKAEFSSIMIQTMDTLRTDYVLEKLLTNQKQCVVIGPTGTGKTLNVQNKLLRGMPRKYMSTFINFSAQTNANQTQDMIDAKLDKRRKGIYAPPLGKQYVIFIDDLNMPALEEYGAQPPIEIVRQWMDHSGWYDRKAIGSFMTLIDITYCCAMGPPGGGRNNITDRLMRHFNFLTMTELSTESRETIFTPILTAYLGQASKDTYKDTTAGLLVENTIAVFDKVLASLLPTPARVHYTFNLRDLAKVFQGMLMNNTKALEGEVDVVRSWVHECNRVFRDRLINDEDRTFFDGLLKEKVKESFGYEWPEIEHRQPLFYGDFMDASQDPRIYEELPDLPKVKEIMDEALVDYNDTNSSAKMNLVLFEDAIQHCCRVSRVIRQPLGNALLLGVGGSGRQSMTRLAAHLAEFKCFQIELAKNYGMVEWREDLKKLMTGAGMDNEPVVFLFSDTQIKDESFLEDLNNILNSGDVPGIYEGAEMDAIYAAMKPIVQGAGLAVTKANMFAMYCNRVRSNVHSVICMSPIGEIFRSRLRQFPALVSCCTIDWFSAWPDEALISVAQTLLADIPTLPDKELIAKVVKECGVIHQSVIQKSSEFEQSLGRVNYVTPTAYLSLIEIFVNMIGDKQKSLKDARDKTANGMTKLQATEVEVEELQEELTAMQPMLKQASEETEVAMVEITKNKAIAQETAIVVGEKEASATEEAAATKAIADDAQRDLDEALPALDQAVASLKSLKKDDIVEVKNFSDPPGGVKMVMEGVCIMFSVKPKMEAGDKPGQKVANYWAVTGPLLVNPAKFLDSLFQYDKENIPESCIKKIKPYIENESFTPTAIAKVSKACTAICAWVRAMYKYHNVAKMVEPKRKALAEANASLQVTMKVLAEAKAQLQQVTDQISSMEVKFDAMVAKKQQLEDKADECTQKLARAERLIGGLGGEKIRWAKSIELGDKLLLNVVGDIVVSAGTVAYLGPFTEEYREALRKTWRESQAANGLAHTDGADLISTLSDAVEVRDWQIHGLPKDQMATENACVVKYSSRWPLFIDPQSQANRWIKMKEGDKLVVMKLSDRDFLRSLENAVRFGSPCLLENVGEELDPALEPILLRQTYKSAGGLVIKLGDSVIPYHDDFAFYITTKLPNPLYTPEVSTKVTVINFTLSPTGLEDQMLGLVVAKERPDLEEAKNELIVNNAKMKAELKSLENLILKLLSECEGSPVDDIDLIEALDASKIKSDEINLKVAAAEETEKEIDVIRMKYVPVAVRSQLLFFCVTSLANVDPMYQYSLEWFRTIFLQSLENSEQSEDLEERIGIINDYFSFSLYSNVCRSLFEKDKLLFSFLMCVRILQERGEIDDAEWKFLIVGGTTIPEEAENPAPDWISDRMWMDISMLPILPKYATIQKEFKDDLDGWKKIFDSTEPHKEPFPGKWDTYFDSFQKLLVVKCLRYDKLPDMMQDFVAASIGQRFIEPQTANLSQVFPDTTPSIPLIFVLSNGTDPAADLLTFAEEMKFTKKLNSISLGQGQGPKAENMFRMGVERGTWVFFQNCHLSPSWMPTLERLIENIDPGKVHRDFRLWLTSMPSPKFPVPVLQNGSKMTVEPPRGIKANLLNAYDPLTDEYLNQGSKTDTWKSLLLSLCIFHGVLIERRKFGPLGFNIPYGYTQSDLAICMTQLNMFLEDYEEPPYKVLVYTAGHINYGGRVTDDWDRRCQLTLLADFYNDAVPKAGFKFSPSGVYTQPEVTDYEGYLEFIKERPINDNPEMFGLHDNANITYANNETDGLLKSILNAGGSGGGGGSGGPDRDRILMELAEDILGKIAEPFDIRAIMKKYPVMYEESMNTVLIQEAIRFNKLLAKVHSSLKELKKALKGLVVMSEPLEKASNALFNNTVPDLWQKVAYPSLKPLAAWVTDLAARVAFITKWYDEGVPPMFWISGFYFPQAFLTGSLQNYARQHGASIDTLSFSFEVINRSPESIKRKPKDGCYIYGLYLEGARWDAKEGYLVESQEKELFTQMSPFLLKPEVNREKPTTGIYDCPCYKTLKRAGLLSTTGHSTNFVLPLEIPSNEDESHWIKRGVALFCALNY